MQYQLTAIGRPLYVKKSPLYSNNADNSLAQKRTRHNTNFAFSFFRTFRHIFRNTCRHVNIQEHGRKSVTRLKWTGVQRKTAIQVTQWLLNNMSKVCGRTATDTSCCNWQWYTTITASQQCIISYRVATLQASANSPTFPVAWDMSLLIHILQWRANPKSNLTVKSQIIQ